MPRRTRPHRRRTPPPTRTRPRSRPGPLRTLARVRGEVDAEHAAAVSADLVPALAASRHGLDLDLSGVTFCDSAGLHVLLGLNRMAAGSGKSLVLTAVSRRVARLLGITGAERVFTIR
ncbi:STAS domain-containing protein [Streptomyces sp. NPDC091268]|uniref:STAS domain-containing protein n=1 Tax=Streptomyces sp. NPDC091268 TaxID=3365979 RepID=UPI0038171820